MKEERMVVEVALKEALLRSCGVDARIAVRCCGCGRGRRERVWLSIEVESQRS